LAGGHDRVRDPRLFDPGLAADPSLPDALHLFLDHGSLFLTGLADDRLIMPHPVDHGVVRFLVHGHVGVVVPLFDRRSPWFEV